MIDKHIEVVTCDSIGMKETAFGSVNTAQVIYNVIKSKYAHVTFNVAKSVKDLEGIAKRRPDLVVLCAKYLVEESSQAITWLSEFFSLHEIPYTGSNRVTLNFDSDKGAAKRIVLDNHLATAKFFFACPGMILSEAELPLPLPLFVKPMDAANGNGIDQNSLVHDFASYEEKVAEVFSTYNTSVLIEEYLPGREFTVAILDSPLTGERLVSPVEIIVPKNVKGDRILGCLEKLQNGEKLAMVSEPELSSVSELASDVFSALGARDFGRIDIKMDTQGIPHFMEANLVPGMTPKTSYFPLACFYNQQLSYEAVVLRIAELALLRAQAPVLTPPNSVMPPYTRTGKIAA